MTEEFQSSEVSARMETIDQTQGKVKCFTQRTELYHTCKIPLGRQVASGE